MSAKNEQPLKNWWAEGDSSVHSDSLVGYAVDAHSTFLTMCRHFLMARTYIYITAWGMTPLMELVRGTDQRAGPDGSPQQEALLAELRAEGLQEPEMDFWCSHELTVQKPRTQRHRGAFRRSAWLLQQRSRAQKPTGPSTCMRKSRSSTISGPRSALPI